MIFFVYKCTFSECFLVIGSILSKIANWYLIVSFKLYAYSRTIFKKSRPIVHSGEKKLKPEEKNKVNDLAIGNI